MRVVIERKKGEERGCCLEVRTRENVGIPGRKERSNREKFGELIF